MRILRAYRTRALAVTGPLFIAACTSQPSASSLDRGKGRWNRNPPAPRAVSDAGTENTMARPEGRGVRGGPEAR